MAFAPAVHRVPQHHPGVSLAVRERTPGTVPATVEEDVAAFMTRFLSGERYVTTHLRPNGRWVHVTWRTLPDGRRLLVHRDVTELQRRELELEEARDAIERERADDAGDPRQHDGWRGAARRGWRIPDGEQGVSGPEQIRTTNSWRCAICATRIAGRPLKGHVPMFGATLDEHAGAQHAALHGGGWLPIDFAATVRSLG